MPSKKIANRHQTFKQTSHVGQFSSDANEEESSGDKRKPGHGPQVLGNAVGASTSAASITLTIG